MSAAPPALIGAFCSEAVLANPDETQFVEAIRGAMNDQYRPISAAALEPWQGGTRCVATWLERHRPGDALATAPLIDVGPRLVSGGEARGRSLCISGTIARRDHGAPAGAVVEVAHGGSRRRSAVTLVREVRRIPSGTLEACGMVVGRYVSSREERTGLSLAGVLVPPSGREPVREPEPTSRPQAAPLYH